MKIYINRQPVSGPWGGGNRTVAALVSRLTWKGHKVVHNLKDADIDILFCFDPRPNNFGEDIRHIFKYRDIHGARIVQRVGDLGLHSKPHLTQMLEQSIPHVNAAIFISRYAMEYLMKLCVLPLKSYVMNLAPPSKFFDNRVEKDIDKKKIKIVTHHWSTNPKKGFDYYQALDKLIDGMNFEFTYIGRKPDDVIFSNSKYIEPMGADELVKELPEHDIYLTASVEETGGNHVLEALAAGLPVVYHKDGCGIVNYCEGYGEEYGTLEEMVKKLSQVANNYSEYKRSVMSYSSNLEQMIEKYVCLMEDEFEKLQSERKY
jgi:glycosyltransferase involved in cell wall biosynthesis